MNPKERSQSEGDPKVCPLPANQSTANALYKHGDPEVIQPNLG